VQSESTAPLIPDEIKARRRELLGHAEQEAQKALDAQQDRERLVKAGNLVEDLGSAFENESKADKDYLARWLKAMAAYKAVLTELEQKAEKVHQTDENHSEQWAKVVLFQRGWLDRLKQPAAGVADCFGDILQPAVNIFLAADTEPDRAATELADLAATDPGCAMQIAGCLRRGIRAVAEGRWLGPVCKYTCGGTPPEVIDTPSFWQPVEPHAATDRTRGKPMPPIADLDEFAERPSVPTAEWCLLPAWRVRWEGKAIRLTPHLYRLLEYLLKQRRDSLKAVAVQDAVWGKDNVHEKTFANCFSSLNNALAPISFPLTWHVKAGHVHRQSC
jgi:hypothetical protein